MPWNWELKNWPNFTYDIDLLTELEQKYNHEVGVLSGVIKHLSEVDKNQFIVELMSDEALNSFKIEGELLDRDSLQSSIKQQFGLSINKKKLPLAEQGMAQLLVDIYKNFSHPLSHEVLYQWHQLVMQGGRQPIHNIGCYRDHKEPMQIISGTAHAPKIHFTAPPSAQVPKEMGAFVNWFNKTMPKGSSPLSALTRAGIAHCYFEAIHPFEDGNGRIGRALVEKALSQCMGKPTLIAVSHTIEANRKKYYQMLGLTNTSLDITKWLDYFAQIILQAQATSLKWLEFLINKTKFFDKYKDQLNARQHKVVIRIFQAGLGGFVGGLSANNYISIAKTSASTATRDLQDLVKKNILQKTGAGKATRYWLRIH